jgi:hypothetical protein
MQMNTVTGALSVHSGLCGTAGLADGTFLGGLVRLTTPRQIVMDPLYPTNFFVVDNTAAATASRIRYVNNSGTLRNIMGTAAPALSVTTIAFSITPYKVFAIAGTSSQFCFASGGAADPTTTHGVACYARGTTNTLSLYIGNQNNPGLGTTIFRGHIQKNNNEQEGIGRDITFPENIPVSLAGPQGLAFDNEGNLYISERYNHAIRMVKRWY